MVKVNTPKIYCKKVREDKNYFANWDFRTTFEVGDFGVVENFIFQKYGNIKKKKWSKIKVGTYPGNGWTDFNSSGVSRTKGWADLSTDPVKAKFGIKFNKDHSFYGRFNFHKTTRLENLHDVSFDLREKWTTEPTKNGWYKDYCLVSEVFFAKPSFLIIGSKKNTRVNVEGKAPKTALLDLLDLKAGMSIKSDNELSQTIEEKGEIAAYFKLVKFRLKFFGFGGPGEVMKPAALEMPGITKVEENVLVYEYV
jgi:hypothetical protein